MNLKKQLAELEQERYAVLRVTRYEVARWKRDTRNALSPARFVRKNMRIVLATAFAAGLVMAPGSGASQAAEPSREAGGRKETQAAAPQRKRGFLRGILGQLLSRAVAQMDWMYLMRVMMERLNPQTPVSVPSHESDQPHESHSAQP